jgi:hypothetical protein
MAGELSAQYQSAHMGQVCGSDLVSTDALNDIAFPPHEEREKR